MNNPILQKSFTAEAAINPYRILKLGAADGGVVQGAGVNDALIAISNDVGAAIGERQDAITHGIAFVTYGGAVTRGDWLTSDANGKAVAAAPGAGVNNNVIGRALVSGVLDDVGSALISQSRIQG